MDLVAHNFFMPALNKLMPFDISGEEAGTTSQPLLQSTKVIEMVRHMKHRGVHLSKLTLYGKVDLTKSSSMLLLTLTYFIANLLSVG